MRALALVAVAVAAGCSELPSITAGQCGNGILEAHEDCDNSSVLCVQCNLICADEGACPPGFACGVDAVCHAATGAFEPEARTSFPFPVIGFRSVDVDADGVGDVVGINATAMTVRYGEPSGTLTTAYNVILPLITGFPALTHLVDDETDDVVFPTADGLVAYTGAFGVPSPRQFPLGGGDPAENMDGINPFDGVQVDETALGLFGPSGGPGSFLTFGLFALTISGPQFDAIAAAMCGPPEIADQTKWQEGKVIRYASGDNTFIVFTYTRTCVLQVREDLTPDAPGTGTCPPPPLRTEPCKFEIVSLTPPNFPKLPTTLMLADLDGDGCPSLISQSASSVEEFAGTGSGGNCTISTTATSLPALADPIIGIVPIAPAMPNLAPEALVTAFGIHGLDTMSSSWRLMYVSDRPMEATAVGDVNGDGGMDVVLRTSSPNFDVARRVLNDDAFLLVRTPTTGAVDEIVFGDFDGDQRGDLAYVEDLGGAERLSIAYGTSGGLAPGVAADAFQSVELMVPIQVKDSTDPFGIVDDLIVIDVVQTTPQPSPEITILHGSPNRTMLSFYGPPVPTPGTPFRGVVAGDFVDDAVVGIDFEDNPIYADSSKQIDLFALQSNVAGQTALWVIPGLPNARLGDAQGRNATTMLPPRTNLVGDCIGNASDPRFCLNFAAYIAWPVVPKDEAGSRDVVLAIDFKGGASPTLMRIDPATPDAPPTFEDNLFGAGGKIFAFDVVDIEDDNLPEIVAAFSTTSSDNDPAAPDGHVSLCHMQRNGTSAGCVDVATDILGDSTLECVDAVRGRVEPRCSIADSYPDGTPRRKLVVLCRKDGWSYAVPISARDGMFTASIDNAIVAVPGQIGQMQLGDVTGDRVDDLLAVDTMGGIPTMNVFRQLPTKEHNACFAD